MYKLIINSRHSHEFVNIDNNGYFGFELELDSSKNTKIFQVDKFVDHSELSIAEFVDLSMLTNMHVESDTSLICGIELVSDIHSDATFNNIDWDILKDTSDKLGYDDSGKAGFHLHIAKSIFKDSDKAISKLYRALNLWKDLYYRLLNIKIDDLYFSGHELYFDAIENHLELDHHEYRKYSVLYLPDDHCSDTIEFRAFRVGVEFELVRHIVKLLTGICKNIENCSFEDLSDLSKLCELVPIETKEYYKKYLNI